MKQLIVACVAAGFLLAGLACSEQALNPDSQLSPAEKPLNKPLDQDEPGTLELPEKFRSVLDIERPDQFGPVPVTFLIRPEFPEWESDGFSITDVKIDGDQLSLAVQYSGGCRPHTFRLVSTFVEEGRPFRASLRLYHNAHSDPCDEVVRNVIDFDLTALRKHFEEQYQEPCADIALVLVDASLQNFSPTYSLCDELDDEPLRPVTEDVQ